MPIPALGEKVRKFSRLFVMVCNRRCFGWRGTCCSLNELGLHPLYTATHPHLNSFSTDFNVLLPYKRGVLDLLSIITLLQHEANDPIDMCSCTSGIL